jgi:hypothetical protein
MCEEGRITPAFPARFNPCARASRSADACLNAGGGETPPLQEGTGTPYLLKGGPHRSPGAASRIERPYRACYAVGNREKGFSRMKRLLVIVLCAVPSLSSFAFAADVPPPSVSPTSPGEYLANEYKVEPENAIEAVGVIKNLSDDELLETVQRQTFRYFWHYAHPNSGMARERSNTVQADFYLDFINEANGEPNLSKGTFGPEACAVGGTGFGILAIIVAVERKWISREAALDRLIQIVDFLAKADSYHGIYPHFINGDTGRAIAFDRLDDGSDIVETSYLMMGLLSARAYFDGGTAKEKYLARRIGEMWNVANWSWHVNADNSRLLWHWSPRNGFDRNFPIRGWNEALITYIIAASSRRHPVSKDIYEKSWVSTRNWRNGKSYYEYVLPLGNAYAGGPLFFSQYTFMGVDPNGLKDDHGIDYGEQTRNHTLINRAYSIDNPKKYKGYGEKAWGLTAGDSVKGYIAHAPEDDRGVIQPTAALSSMPYTPAFSMQALRYFYEEKGDKLWSSYGFVDGYSDQFDWTARSHLAIDQGPIIVMIENYRSGLLWKIFMNIPEIQNGMKQLGFDSPYFSQSVGGTGTSAR